MPLPSTIYLDSARRTTLSSAEYHRFMQQMLNAGMPHQAALQNLAAHLAPQVVAKLPDLEDLKKMLQKSGPERAEVWLK